MRDLPGFYWDEERQRYFALAQENVARDLSRYDLRRVSAHDEPAPVPTSDANNQSNDFPRRDRTHLGANAPENRRRNGKKASSSRARDFPGDGSRRKKKRGGDASSPRDLSLSSRSGVAAPSERRPSDDAQKKPSGASREGHSASPFEALRARALGMALGGKNLRGRRVASPSDIVAAARRAHVRGLTLAGEIGANAFGHGFELAVEPLRVGHEWDTHANPRSFHTPDRILLAGAPHAESSGNAFSYVKRLRSVDHTGMGWGFAETAVCERSASACEDDAFANRALASSFMARETQRMRAVEWSAVRNAGIAGVMGFEDAVGPPCRRAPSPASDDDFEDYFATQHGATPHACLSTSLMGDGANRDPGRPPGGVAAISLTPPHLAFPGARVGRANASSALFFAAGDSPGRFRGNREFKNTRPGFFDAAVSPRTGAVACAAESHGLLLYDVRANRTVHRVARPLVSVAMSGDAVAVACDVGPHADASWPAGARAETFAVGLRDGTLAFVDSRTSRPSYFAPPRSARSSDASASGVAHSFVTDLVALRAKPGLLVAASADGGLGVWDARQTRAPARVLARGSPACVFDTRRRCAVDASERFVAFDQTHHVRAVAGRPSTAREVEALAAWDLESGTEAWRRERVAAPGAAAEVATALAVETEPGVRVWAGTRERLRLYVPKQTLGPGGDASLGVWG